MTPLKLVGGFGSPYTRKMRAVLRFRRIPFTWIMRGSRDDVGIPAVPVALIPDYLAALDPEAHVVDRAKIAEGLAQIFNFYQHRTPAFNACAFWCSKNKTATECFAPVAV